MQEIRITKRLEEFTVQMDLNISHRVTGLYGPSGSGKTTILNCIAGLLAPNQGSVIIDGVTLYDSQKGSSVSARDRRIGYVFQDGLLFDHLSVARNLAYGQRSQGGPDFDQVTDVLELGGLLERRAGSLSGGEKRRVAIGRALLSAPRLLLLDEPLAGLDRRLAGKTLGYIQTVLDSFDLPAVYVSHWVSDIVFLCGEVVVLDRGRVVAQGAPTELIGVMESLDPLRPPALKNIFTVDVAEVDSDAGMIACELDGQRLLILKRTGGRVSRVTVMVPARDIILARTRPAMLSARNILRGTIRRIEEVGAHNVVFVDVGREWMVEVTRAAARDLALEAGAEVFLVVKASTIHCVDLHG